MARTVMKLPTNVYIQEDDVAYADALNKIFTKKMYKKIRTLGKDAINGGIAYLYPYYDELGDFQIKVFPSYELMPIWKDNEHIDLEAGVRIYPTAVYENGSERRIERVEVYTVNGSGALSAVQY